jgi:hypothetical protein
MSRRLWAQVDRIGGLVVYRTVGSLAFLLALATGFVSWDLLTGDGDAGGSRVVGVVLTSVAVLLALSAAWCFSPNRRLSDLE